ncbi:MAG: 2-C-methyl-D-erythritol 4-phosphate cytidylyltransferase, partial [Candidatus Omnitrophica bacterium]|nr:2-C-methyl-D-erythritol 4-phosphate cytidylyltransferase [Candidatus Omnitrophota bacterium]
MRVTAIVLAAGKGARLGSRIFKPLVKINSLPLVIYCLKTLSKHTDIKDIIIVANSKNLKGIIRQLKRYRIRKIKAVVLGGRRRQDSVRNGLKAVARRADLVLIHDGVRPFIKKREVSALIKEAKRSGAAILAVPVKDTIKKVTKSPPRL